METSKNTEPNYNKQYEAVTWIENEYQIRKSRSAREAIQNKYTRSFFEVLQLKLKKSIFRCYIDIFNAAQTQNHALNRTKLEIADWDMKTYQPKDFERFEKNNDFMENGTKILRYLIGNNIPVTLKYLNHNIKFLRLDSIYVSKKYFLRVVSTLLILKKLRRATIKMI